METQKLNYYRGYQLVTDEQRKIATKLWGDKGFCYFDTKEKYQGQNTGIDEVFQLLMFIENDESLSERITALEERISRGLTPSTAYYSDYVETNILWKLLREAIEKYNSIVDKDDEISNIYDYGEEFRRIFNLPPSGKYIAKKIDKQGSFLAGLPDLTVKEKIKYKNKYSVSCESESIFKEYFIKGRFHRYGLDHSIKGIFGELSPFIAKVYNCSTDGYFQLFVYDYRNSNKVLKKALEILEEKNLITLEL